MFSDELSLLDEFELEGDDGQSGSHQHQLVNAPLLKLAALQHHLDDFPSRGLLGVSDGERIYINTNAPNSGIVCGVQGSGKSHTLSRILENALISSSRIGTLPEPLAALVFHFDQQECGRPCEAAFLASSSERVPAATSVPKISVLCSPSNLARRTRAYSGLTNVRVAPLFLSEQDLTVDRMLSLMGCDNLEVMPLYMNTVIRLMRSMGVDRFTYSEFKRQLSREKLQGMQTAMLKLRLDLLDSFLRPGSPDIQSYFAVGDIVLVDLTDPFLDGTTAGLLFDIVLDSFIGWQAASGKLVVLDEAHKFLTSSEASRLNKSLANTIRLQRHLATRVVIATQEPTVIPPTILDLSSFIICHRFSSPSWCSHLAKHVNDSRSQDMESWFQKVMLLATGEGIMFSPTTLVNVDEEGKVELLGGQFLKIKVRPRLTRDGGRSLLAVGREIEARGTTETLTSIAQPTQAVVALGALALSSASPAVGSPNLPPSPTVPVSPPLPPLPTPVASSPAPKPAIFLPLTPYNRFDGLVSFLREQQALGIHQVTWSDVAENVRLRHAVDGTQLRVRAFLTEAREEGIVSVTGEPEDGTDWVSLLPIIPAPATAGSALSPLSTTTAPQPTALAPVVGFQGLVAFLEQWQAIGVVRVPWSVVQAAVADPRGTTEQQQKPAHFLAEAIQKGVVVAEACITPTWIALPPSSSPADSNVRQHATPSQTHSAPAATILSAGQHVTPANIPPRFHPLVDFLKQQHASGIPHVSFANIGERVRQRKSTAGAQLRVKAFVEDAQHSGVVVCGGSGDGRWVALQTEQIDVATPVVARASAASTSTHFAVPSTAPVTLDHPLMDQADRVATVANPPSQSVQSTVRTRAKKKVPKTLQPLISTLREKAKAGVAFVLLKDVVAAMGLQAKLQNTEKVKQLVQRAQQSGLVAAGSWRPGEDWVSLLRR